MDTNPQSTKPISDDQELAKVLAGINQQTDQAMQFETTPTPAPSTTTPPTADPVISPPNATSQPDKATEEPSDATPPEAPEPAHTVSVEDPVVEDAPAIPSTPSSNQSPTDLTSIKKDALNDLRPLVDKLDIAPQEKFDTYLLLIRSTDDKALIAPAYAAAQAITDEADKAQALLDVIKEIDYLSNQQK